MTHVSVPFGRSNTPGCGVIPVGSAGCSSPDRAPAFINSAGLQKCNVMRWILGAVRLQILLYEGICCSEGFGCAVLLTLAVSAQRSLTPDSAGSQAWTRRWLLLGMMWSSVLPSQG